LDQSSQGQIASVQSWRIHPQYRDGHPPNDIALLLLASPLNLGHNINTVCLPSGNADIDLSKCVASGWGNDPKEEAGW